MCIYIHINIHIYLHIHIHIHMFIYIYTYVHVICTRDVYISTRLLRVLCRFTGFARLLLRYILGHAKLFHRSDWCIIYFRYLLCSPLALPSSFLDVLHCLPHAAGMPLESALNLVRRMSSCATLATHFAKSLY